MWTIPLICIFFASCAERVLKMVMERFFNMEVFKLPGFKPVTKFKSRPCVAPTNLKKFRKTLLV